MIGELLTYALAVMTDQTKPSVRMVEKKYISILDFMPNDQREDLLSGNPKMNHVDAARHFVEYTDANAQANETAAQQIPEGAKETVGNRGSGGVERRNDPASWLRETINPIDRRIAPAGAVAPDYPPSKVQWQHAQDRIQRLLGEKKLMVDGVEELLAGMREGAVVQKSEGRSETIKTDELEAIFRRGNCGTILVFDSMRTLERDRYRLAREVDKLRQWNEIQVAASLENVHRAEKAESELAALQKARGDAGSELPPEPDYMKKDCAYSFPHKPNIYIYASDLRQSAAAIIARLKQRVAALEGEKS